MGPGTTCYFLLLLTTTDYSLLLTTSACCLLLAAYCLLLTVCYLPTMFEVMPWGMWDYPRTYTGLLKGSGVLHERLTLPRPLILTLTPQP